MSVQLPTHVHPAPSASLSVSVASTPASMPEDRVQRRKQQRLSKNIVPDAFPTDFERYGEVPRETLWAVDWKHNCLLPASARNDQLGATYGQRRLALQAAFIQDNQQVKWFFNESPVKLMHKMTWLVGAMGNLRKLGTLREKSLEETWQIVPESNRHSIGLSFFSSARRDILRKGYMVM